MRKTNTLITSAIAILIASTVAQARTPLPATGEGGTAQRGVRENGAAELRIAQANETSSEAAKSYPQGPDTSRGTVSTNFNIPKSQPLGTALRTLVSQANTNIMFDESAVAGKTATALEIQGTLKQALTQLLKNTGLEYRFLNDATVVVGPKGTLTKTTQISYNPSPGTGEGGTTKWGVREGGKLRLAQENKDEASAESQNQKTPDESVTTDESTKSLQEIVVTGTHIRGVAKIAQPSFSVTREEIDKAGFNTVEDLAEKLPQNFNVTTPLGRTAGQLSNNNVAGQNWVRVTAMDLRGLGAESTLTLINGRRRAGSIFGRVVDISSLPLSTIERVDVVTGGASAIYGADAVAGVVNFITRRDFEGAESHVSYGGPSEYGGGSILNGGHMQGFDFDRGSLVVAYDYDSREASNLIDNGHASTARLPDGRRYVYRFSEADVTQHSAYVAGRLRLGEQAELYGDAFYNEKKVKKQDSVFYRSSAGVEVSRPSGIFNTVSADSYGGAMGVKLDAGSDWSVDVGAAHSISKSPSTQFGDDHFLDPANDTTFWTTYYHNEAVVSSLAVVADGPLPSISGVSSRGALGIELRREEAGHGATFEQFSSTGAQLAFSDQAFAPPDRELRSVFAELNVPLVEEGGRGLRRVDLALGARYDEYDDFGGAFNWTAGLTLQPFADLTLRGSYATAMRAPSVHDAAGGGLGDPSLYSFFIWEGPDPKQGGATTPILFIDGNAPLEPEKAKSWSLGFDYVPTFASGSKLSFSWFSIDYDGRIDRPLTQFDEYPLWLTFESAFADITTRNPTVDQLQALLDARAFGVTCCLPGGMPITPDVTAQQILEALPELVIADNRLQNLAVESVEGFDLRLDTNVSTRIGRVDIGVDATYTLNHDRRVTANSPAIDRMDSVALPTSFRARGHLGWSKGAWGADLYINYTPGYDNPFPPPDGIAYVSRVSSWTTADLTLRFDASGRIANTFFDRTGVTLAISNLFDTGPPYWSGNTSLGRDFDAANASPVGRFVTVGITKRW